MPTDMAASALESLIRLGPVSLILKELLDEPLLKWEEHKWIAQIEPECGEGIHGLIWRMFHPLRKGIKRKCLRTKKSLGKKITKSSFLSARRNQFFNKPLMARSHDKKPAISEALDLYLGQSAAIPACS